VDVDITMSDDESTADCRTRRDGE